MTEAQLYEQIQQYMNLKWPGVITHWDLSGVNNPSHKTRNLYGRLNSRAWPDLQIAKPKYGSCDCMVGCLCFAHPYYLGLFIEIKKEGTRLTKKDGSWATQHIAEQADMLRRLTELGYKAMFGVGFDDCVRIIEEYLNG